MNDEKLREQLEASYEYLIKSWHEVDIAAASSFALTSIASSLYVIAERMVNQDRDKEV